MRRPNDKSNGRFVPNWGAACFSLIELCGHFPEPNEPNREKCKEVTLFLFCPFGEFVIVINPSGKALKMKDYGDIKFIIGE